MTKIGIITGTTRPGRRNLQVAQWVYDRALKRNDDAEYELVDIADYNLPVLNEAGPAVAQNYEQDNVRKWAAKLDEFDGFIFVTPEYNHSVSPSLANALSFVKLELNNKAAGIVGYGSALGARAVEHLRGILSEFQVAHVQKQGMFSIFTDFENMTTFKPTDLQAESVDPMFDQVIVWTKAMETIRK